MREASLRRVLAVLRARWLLVVALALPVLVGSWGYAASLPPAHTATVVLSFAPGEEADLGASFTRLLPRYEITATTQQALERAEQEAGLPNGGLADAVSADLPGDNLELTLTVTTPVAEASLAAVRSLADSVVEAAADDPQVSVRTALGPENTGSETRERRAIVMAAGLLLMPVPGAALALGLEGSRPRVWLPADLSAAGLPVLQSFPLVPRAGGPAARWSATRGARRFLRLWLLVTGELTRVYGEARDVTPDVVVTSIDGHNHDAERVVVGLHRAAESMRGDSGPGQTYANFRTESWPPDPSTAPPSGRSLPENQPYVLVLRTGLPQDHAQATAELITRQGGRILGSVLLTR